MYETVQTAFSLLAQFTGGRGGIDHVIVNYGIGAMFWSILLWVSLSKAHEYRQPREGFLIWGFSFGLGRELLMLGMAVAVAFDLTTNEKMHVVFPPLEHALSNIAEIVVAAAFVLFLTKRRSVAVLYLKVAIGTIIFVYLATFYWWAEFIIANPTAKFGQVWCDWAFRIAASAAMAWPVYYLWKNARGRVRNVVCVALGFFFLSEFLKLPDMALGEVYENMFAPIRHGLYIAAIPLLGYVYIREQSDELKQAFDLLEIRVQERTVELESALLRLQSEVVKQEQTAKELEAFAYSVAHDLKAPLRAMEGFSTALAEDYGPSLDAEANSYVGHISTSASRMGVLIDDLLEYSRVGRDDMKFVDVDLHEIMTQAVTNMGQDIKDSGAKVTIANELPAVRGHALTLELIFQNLISNAVKFCPLGAVPEVDISGTAVADGIEVVVKDNGIGIAEEDKARIFDIFQRLHSTETYHGTGIGLAIVNKGMNLHSGSVRIESTPGAGTQFHLFFPSKHEDR